MIKKSAFCFALASLVLASCQTEPKKEDTATTVSATPGAPGNVVDSSKTAVNGLTDFKFQMVISNIPSPFETIIELTKVGVEFNKDLMNKPENEKKYLTTTQKALNYGVYGVDLAYLATNKGNTQGTKYFVTAHNLAVSLDAAESLDKFAGSRMDGHWDNKDTVAKVMDEAYAATDKYLRSGERQLAATQILTGSWVESQYITLNGMKGLVKDEKNQFLFKKLYEQKLHIGHLNSLLQEYIREKEFVPVINKLSSLNDEFKKISTEDDLTKERVNELASKVAEVRALIIQ
jgi:hypothetical protein